MAVKGDPMVKKPWRHRRPDVKKLDWPTEKKLAEEKKKRELEKRMARYKAPNGWLTTKKK